MYSPLTQITEHQITLAPSADGAQTEHSLFYLAAGPEDGPLVIFVHGWPELSLSWRHQLPALAALGFRCIAPDMRGYGKSSCYSRHEDYALEACVGDLVRLLGHLKRDQAVWVGHDWGAGVVWALAAHHPQICLGVANLCVPYRSLELGLEATIALVDRDLYPIEQYPAGQWEYMRYYEENFADATAAFEQDTYKVAKLMFRKGNPAGFGQVTGTAEVRQNGGWFGGGDVPDFPADEEVVSEEDLQVYAEGLARNGFFGPDSYYMNHERNAVYSRSAVNEGRLDMPVLFLAGQYDYTCETITSGMAAPMRDYCSQLTEQVVYSGHWMAQERPLDVNAALTSWLATELSQLWRQSSPAAAPQL